MKKLIKDILFTSYLFEQNDAIMIFELLIFILAPVFVTLLIIAAGAQ